MFELGVLDLGEFIYCFPKNFELRDIKSFFEFWLLETDCFYVFLWCLPLIDYSCVKDFSLLFPYADAELTY